MNRSFRAAWVLAILAWLMLPTDFAEAGTNWARLYGATMGSQFSAVRETTDGGFIVVGTAESFGAGGSGVWCLKLDASGDIVWQKTYGGANSDSAAAVEVTSDGGYLLVGRTKSFGAGNDDGWCLRIDASGNVLWQKTYGGAKSDGFNAVRVTSDGGFIVVGITDSFTWDGWLGDVWCLKLDASGNILWQKSYGSRSKDDEWAFDVGTASDGGYIVVAATSSGGAGWFDAWVLKLDAGGSMLWDKTYGGAMDDMLFDLAGTTADGGCILTGFASFNSQTGEGGEGWCIKLDAVGNIVWENTYDGAPQDACLTADGGCLLAGVTFASGAGGADGYCAKLDSFGNVAWQKTYGGTNTDWVTGADMTADGGYVLAGYTYNFGVSTYASWCLKISATGDIDPSCPDLGRDAPGYAIPIASTRYDTGKRPGTSSAVAAPTAVVVVDSTATTTLLCSQSPQPQGPTITSISSRTSKPGSTATIRGTGFSTDKTKVAVYIGTKKVKILNRLKPTSIKFTIPRMKKGTYDVYVVVDGVKSNMLQFRVK